MAATLEAARTAAESVTDPELPMVTLADLGILRDVRLDAGRVTVTITPTYTGCPAMDTIRADLRLALQRRGFDDVTVEMALSPAWTTEWITADGRAKLTRAGIAPPSGLDKLDHRGELDHRRTGPVLLDLQTRRPVACPLCGSVDTRELSRFGSTACKAIHTCRTCGETFDEIKPI